MRLYPNSGQGLWIKKAIYNCFSSVTFLKVEIHPKNSRLLTLTLLAYFCKILKTYFGGIFWLTFTSKRTGQ